MKSTKDLILQTLEILEYSVKDIKDINLHQNLIPTLEKDFFRKLSPMLISRFKIFASLIEATHGDWLSLEEMKSLWEPETISDPRLKEIYNFLLSNIENWENNAGSLFKLNRLSLFAGSADTSEHIYLLWLDGYEEPEVWVYDDNGESRYANLNAYLKAFIDDDISASNISWHLS